MYLRQRRWFFHQAHETWPFTFVTWRHCYENVSVHDHLDVTFSSNLSWHPHTSWKSIGHLKGIKKMNLLKLYRFTLHVLYKALLRISLEYTDAGTHGRCRLRWKAVRLVICWKVFSSDARALPWKRARCYHRPINCLELPFPMVQV